MKSRFGAGSRAYSSTYLLAGLMSQREALSQQSEGQAVPEYGLLFISSTGQIVHSIRQRKDQQNSFLKHFKISLNIEIAAKCLGVSNNSIQRWMKDDPEFKDKVDALREMAKVDKERQEAEKRWKAAAKRTQEAKEEDEKQPFRDSRCQTYYICLDNAARFKGSTIMDCSDCQNRRHKKPVAMEPDEYYSEMWADSLNCCKLLLAIFEPELYFHSHDVRKAIDQQEPEADAPLAAVEWF